MLKVRIRYIIKFIKKVIIRMLINLVIIYFFVLILSKICSLPYFKSVNNIDIAL